ncbi:MAG TPA: ABC transporter substrate-binding protein [Armatimonadota bacterium]
MSSAGHWCAWARRSDAALVVLVLAVSAALGGCGRARDAAGAVPVRLGFYANVNHGVALVGLDRGYFQQVLGPGARLEARSFVGGGDVITGIAAGELDLAYVGPGPAVNAIAHGAELRIVAGASEGGAALVARADLPIRRVADLAGRRVVVPTLAGTQDICLRRLLAEQGLRDSAEGGTVEILHAPPTDLKALLTAHHADAALVAEPWPSRLLADASPPVRVVLNWRQIWRRGHYPSTVLIASNRFLARHPDLVSRWMRGHELGLRLLRTRPEESIVAINHVLKRELGKPMPPATLRAAMANVRYVSALDRGTLAAFVDLMRSCGYLDHPLATAALVSAPARVEAGA